MRAWTDTAGWRQRALFRKSLLWLHGQACFYYLPSISPFFSESNTVQDAGCFLQVFRWSRSPCPCPISTCLFCRPRSRATRHAQLGISTLTCLNKRNGGSKGFAGRIPRFLFATIGRKVRAAWAGLVWADLGSRGSAETPLVVPLRGGRDGDTNRTQFFGESHGMLSLLLVISLVCLSDSGTVDVVRKLGAGQVQ